MSDQELVTEENSSDAAAELAAEPVAAEAEEAGEEPASAEADTVSAETDAPAETSSVERSEATEYEEEDEEKDAGEGGEPVQADADKSAESVASEAETESGVNTIFNLEPRQHIKGTVKNITKFGAFVDLGLPQDGLVHISELSRRKVDKVEDVVSVGEEVDVWVKKVDRKRGRISLTMIKPVLRRIRDISDGDEVEGVVTRLEAYGAFVDIDSERDGLVHISQITHDYIKHPGEALEIGQRVNVKVLKVNRKKRQVDLSIKALLPPPVVEEPPVQEVAKEATGQGGKTAEEKVDVDEQEPVPTAMAVAFASLQEKDDEEESGEQQADKREREKHRQEQDDIIARTLATKE